MSEYGDPDLETVAPLPPLAAETGAQVPAPPPRSGRGPAAAAVAALVVVSLVVGFGVATVVLNARDKSSDNAAATPVIPLPVSPTIPSFTPGSSVFPSVPGTTPGSTTPGPTLPADPDDSALSGLILHQSDVSATDSVALLPNGADLTVATLDLCNGTFPSEAQRTARRQVAQVKGQTAVVSTEAILYRAPSTGAQAFRELQSVAAKCPSSPVVSPVGEDTATTTFRAAPDGAWARTASVERLAYDFTTVDAATNDTSHSIAVYLRRGRALMGVYFDKPDGAQDAVAGRTTVAGIVGVFEARLAKLPANVVNG